MIVNPLQTNTNGLGRRTSRAPERVDFSKIYTSARFQQRIIQIIALRSAHFDIEFKSSDAR